jgi:glycosyltransferase involved in cell wall biosynthesis
MPHLSIVTPCYNEEKNAEDVYRQVRDVVATLAGFTYEHIFIDNRSTDGTAAVLRRLAAADPNVKVILNVRNFGHIRSPYHALLQASGDAVVLLAGDLQDPPAMIRDFVERWQAGFKVVLGVKTESEESPLMFAIRGAYYNLIGRMSDVRLVKNNTGFGLYDRVVIEALRKLDDPYPYFRGLVCELGWESAKIPYRQPARRRGVTANNFYTLYDIAMLGITSHSKVPLRLATMAGFALSVLSFLTALGYLAAKLAFWDSFELGLAPLIIGLFFFGSIQLLFLGVIGEYVGFIYQQVLKRPLVVEQERLNFEARPAGAAPRPEAGGAPLSVVQGSGAAPR